MRNSILDRGSDQNQFDHKNSLLKGRGFTSREILRLATVLIIYLLMGIIGLAGSIFIIIKVINLPSISDFEMVLLFCVACIFLAVTYAGFHGIYEVIRGSK